MDEAEPDDAGAGVAPEPGPDGTPGGVDARPEVPIEPGSPDPENVAFVLLGGLGTCYVIARMAGLV